MKLRYSLAFSSSLWGQQNHQGSQKGHLWPHQYLIKESVELINTARMGLPLYFYKEINSFTFILLNGEHWENIDDLIRCQRCRKWSTKNFLNKGKSRIKGEEILTIKTCLNVNILSLMKLIKNIWSRTKLILLYQLNQK